mmetsp:Transcript_25039/g.41864  ORF Transcript_25039/g.41864 Transcript_25039/m.41864 type:complete len:344 (+) Transcript_25039:432-1463(+)|eukprot:CAMPEP_0174981072 /NCGR_PEP_ID=MMETSP0004_2-20121128/15691_1 /TAXON_ID=420556 /ORGANISM="Ochromonas sp., Strain CCMP1393" /LENGTH=343 /DNA_ID=CAMNT_0016232785 /DNA_START=409 /DNA_END=1440 /DNA_ORIENTATION=-
MFPKPTALTPATYINENSKVLASQISNSLVQREQIVSAQGLNGKTINLVHLPTCHNSEQSKRQFDRNLPTPVIEKMCATIGGTKEKGVELLTQSLYGLAPEATTAGFQSGGGVCMTPFTPAETIATQQLLNMTNHNLQDLAGVLKKKNGGNRVLTSSNPNYAFLKKHKEKPENSMFINGTHLDGNEFTKYTISCPYDQSLKLIGESLDNNNGKQNYLPIGFQLGERGLCIPAVVIGDCGQGETKYQIQVVLRVGDKEKHRAEIGKANGAEEYDIIKNTCAPVINEGFKKMQQYNMLIVEWDTGCDYVMIPIEEFSTANPANRDKLPERMEVVKNNETESNNDL